MSDRQALRDTVALCIEYDDDSPFGTLISGQAETRVKRHFSPLIKMARTAGVQEAVNRGSAMLEALLGSNFTGSFYRGPRELREDLLHPAPTLARPRRLRVDRANAAPTMLPLAAELASELASWIGEWQRGIVPSRGHARELWEGLKALDCFERPQERPRFRGAATFVGHATVLLTGPKTRLLVDPFLMSREDTFPAGYQPITHGDVAPDAVLITHSHRDHFHLDSLIRLGAETTIVVPEVPRESILSIDMACRLRELGFRDVRTLAWGADLEVGDFVIRALPFYGEQPTTESVLHPEVRNAGNAYIVEGGGRRYAFVADAGRDRAGDIRALATESCSSLGPIDVLFGGYRSWSLYPVQYAMSSVPHYLLFVPPALWSTRQQIMNDAEAMVDTAERWKARYVVPYADGGAPWYWQLHLGARLDIPQVARDAHSDPRPEAALRAAADRSSVGDVSIASPVRPLLMRPGDSLEFDASGEATILQNEGHRFPYAHRQLDSDAASDVEPVGLTRKRVLLRLLAREELKRRGLEIGHEQVQAMSDELRRDNGLADNRAMLSWLEDVGLSIAEYSEILLDWQTVIHLEGARADEIEKRLSAQRAFASMRRGVR